LSIKIIYQTLQDRGNHDEVNSHGPYPCKWENTWLGDGFYFWDHFIDNAKWWGTHRYGEKYIICRALCDYNTNSCFDLVGTVEHLEQFKNSVDFLKSMGKITSKTTVRRVLNYLRLQTKSLNFAAIRAYGINSISPNSPIGMRFSNRMIFEMGKPQYLDLIPAIQICIFSKEEMNLRSFIVVYPEKYLPRDALI
jgi:hypothetical protein